MSDELNKSCTMHVISHTHWDREWRYSFQQFRIMLVDNDGSSVGDAGRKS